MRLQDTKRTHEARLSQWNVMAKRADLAAIEEGFGEHHDQVSWQCIAASPGQSHYTITFHHLYVQVHVRAFIAHK